MEVIQLPGDSNLPDLRISNGLLGDRAALEAEWEQYGYWFFRDAIPLDALEEFRAPALQALKQIGVVDPDSDEPVWHGRSLEGFPKAAFGGYEALPGMVRSRRWMDFLAKPSVAAFFQQALGAKANWVAVAESRVTPPGEDVSEGLFTYPHQDGFYNEGYRCLTAWMPLWPVSKATGGLALAEGLHRHGYFHDDKQPPPCPIPPGVIDESAWRTMDYRPGDVVLFDRFLPHSGQRNRSERHFRVSFDVRCVLPGDPVPLFGSIVASTPEGIDVQDLEGGVRHFRLTEKSYVRGAARTKAHEVALAGVPDEYPAGQEVLVTYENDEVVMLREPKY